MKPKRILFKLLIILLIISTAGIITILSINSHVKLAARSSIIPTDEASDLENVDCIVVLGCLVRDDGSLSTMLSDRLNRGIDLYFKGAAPKILMSGDHGQANYDEVNAMKKYAIESGVPSEDVFMDHAGFSTYESIYRAKEIFGADKIIIVTQEYHLYRALYIADKLGIEAYGVSSDYREYTGQSIRDFREILARCKDFGTSILKPKPTYLGEAIPISGNGDITNDT